MSRVFGRVQNFAPVRKLGDTRYRTNFDLVPVGDDPQFGRWTVKDYFAKPTTEEVRADVVAGTISRYQQDGLEPPKEEEIDLTDYAVE